MLPPAPGTLRDAAGSTVAQGSPARRSRASASEFRVALVLPGRGPAGLFGPECRAAAELAAAEVDAAGGVAGRRLAFVPVEAGGPPRAVAARVRDLLDRDAVDAVTGWHLSDARTEIAAVVRGRVPYVYAAAYEGGERTDGVLCSGEVPGDQVVASLRWFRDERSLRRWVVVGNDYVWPRGTATATREGLRGSGIEIVAERFLPLGTDDPLVWDDVVAGVVRSGAQGVLTLLVGSDAVRFNRAFAASGAPAGITRFGPFTDETVVLANGAENNADLYVSAGWFAHLATASAREFVAGFSRAFDLLHGTAPGGVVPLPGTMAETTYSAVHLLAGLDRAGPPTVEATRTVRSRWGWDSPHGPVDLRDGAARHPVHLAVADGVDLRVVTRVH